MIVISRVERAKSPKEIRMSNTKLMQMIEDAGTYCKVKIDRDGNVTGMRRDQDWRYDAKTNTGGRRLVGYKTELEREYA